MNGEARLVWGSTVLDDNASDRLTGNGALDWFFANRGPAGVLDPIADRNYGGAERVN